MTSLAQRAGLESVIAVEGITLPFSASDPLSVAFDGAPVWSLRATLDGKPVRQGTLPAWFVPWPAVLEPYLDGWATITVTDHATGAVVAEDEIQFGLGEKRVRVADRRGHPLAVNKVGTLSRSFGATGSQATRELLEGTAAIIETLRELGGVEAMLNYGALLGIVREGGLLAHDCDLDLTYLSARTHPADIILESYRLERVIRAAGWVTQRMSGADFKVGVPLSDGRVEQVDVFAAFHVRGTFYQLGNRSGHLPVDAILPVSWVELEGVPFPVPREPERMLAFLYGEGWRTPDPSFRYADDPFGVRRLDGWLRGFRTEQPLWNRFFRAGRARRVPRRGSRLARWVHRRVPAGDLVVDLGSGTGRDAAYFAKKGRPVIAFDTSPQAISRTTSAVRRRLVDGTPDVRRLTLDELRTVVLAGAELALDGRPVHLHARHLADSISPQARRNLWLLARMALAEGGYLFLEFSSWRPGLGDEPGWEPRPLGLVHRLDADHVVGDIEAHGGRVIRRVDGPGQDMFDDHDPWVTRLQVSFARTSRGGDA